MAKNVEKRLVNRAALIREHNKRLSCGRVGYVRNVDLVDDVNQVESIVFGPDPVTGLPCSDIALSEQQMREPAVQAYISKYLSRQRAAEQGFEDIASDEIPDRRMQLGAERDQILQGLREVVNKSMERKD